MKARRSDFQNVKKLSIYRVKNDKIYNFRVEVLYFYQRWSMMCIIKKQKVARRSDFQNVIFKIKTQFPIMV